MIEQTLDIATKDGAMETFICRPERGAHPPVLFLMDAPGIREELRDMARRLGTAGYCVLLPNLYYRAGRDTKFGPDVLAHGSPEHQRMRRARRAGTPADGGGAARPVREGRQPGRARALPRRPSRLRLPAAQGLRQAGRRAALGALDRPLPPPAGLSERVIPVLVTGI